MNASLTKNLAITQPLQFTYVNNLLNFEFLRIRWKRNSGQQLKRIAFHSTS